MTHDEIIKECDRISKNEHESWHYIYSYLKDKEAAKLNNTKVYECQKTLSWYIDIEGFQDVIACPFGFFFADYLNQLVSLRSKEAFIAYEKRMRRSASSEKEINPTFDKKFRFFIWNFDERTEYDASSGLSDEELGYIYDNCCWLWEYVKKDIRDIIKNLDYQNSNTLPPQDILYIYQYVRRMVLLIWHRQINSSIYDRNNSNDKYTRITKEDILIREKDNKELISHGFAERITVLNFRYMGYETLLLDDNTNIFCKKYDIPNLLFLVAEDLMRFMLHQTIHTFNFCPECGCMFIATHGNQKHCPACKEDIRQKKRKENPYRYTHKKITDFLNTNGSEENPSEMFRNESNYYWEVIRGNTPKVPKETWYHDDIKTKEDYMEWLNNEFLKFKELKKENAL